MIMFYSCNKLVAKFKWYLAFEFFCNDINADRLYIFISIIYGTTQNKTLKVLTDLNEYIYIKCLLYCIVSFTEE